MYVDPLAALSKKDLDILTEEAEESGEFRPAVDKAIFEAAQNPGKGKIHQGYPKPCGEDHIHDGARKRKGREGRTHRQSCFPWEKN